MRQRECETMHRGVWNKWEEEEKEEMEEEDWPKLIVRDTTSRTWQSVGIQSLSDRRHHL